MTLDATEFGDHISACLKAMRRRASQEVLLFVIAIFALIWTIARAYVQSMTMDEANTYSWFVATSDLWHPFPNNHVLNSLLMWLSIHTFGTSILAMRLPAILGGAFYIWICHLLCRILSNRFIIRLLVFICLVYNPMILDYMVAARGYGLANAFLMAAVAIPAWHTMDDRASLPRSCVLASLALGLSFTANFAFAFIDLCVFVAVTIWAINRRGGYSALRIIGLCVLPGMLMVLVLCGYTLAHWKKEDLIWGAHSLKEMRQSLVQSSLYQLDPRFREAGWQKVAAFLRPRLPPFLLIVCVLQLVATILDRSWFYDKRSRWLLQFGGCLASILAVSVVIHWLAFHFDNVLLPVGRTGIFIVSLTTLLIGTIAAAPNRSRSSRWLGRGIIAGLSCLACYFVLCLRLSYFKEYQFDADVKEIYSILAQYNHKYGIIDVGMTDLSISALNFYRLRSKTEIFHEFKEEPSDARASRAMFVMNEVNQRQFIEEQKLVIVYRGTYSNMVIALRPDGPIPLTRLAAEP